MEPLTKPMAGISFWIGPVLFHFNFAKTLLWVTDDKRETRTTYLISAHTLQKENARAFGLIIGPFKMNIGIRPSI